MGIENWLLEQIEKSLEAMNKDRTIIQLYHEGYTQDEIAKMFGMHQATISRRLRRLYREKSNDRI